MDVSPELLADCVHCGFCLTTCPSYNVFHTEMDSPRGRIVLMREPVDATVRLHFDRCLGCMACVTACPSGVRYDELLEQVRPQLERSRPGGRRLVTAILGLFTRPGLLRAMAPLLAVGGPVARRLPSRLLRLTPRARWSATVARLPLVTPPAPSVEPRGRVAFMQGCVQRVLFGDVNAATVRVLSAEGWEVHAPRQPRCCGALHLHSGREEPARELARATIAAYAAFDHVVVNVAGCGSAMKEYGRILGTDEARAFSAKVLDVHELLARFPAQAVRHPLPLTVAYHDACHLAHAQRVRRQPRDLLRSIPGLTLVEPAEWELCCGSAGVYNVTQPEAAAELGRRKVANLLATGATTIAAANPGCAMQIAAHAPSSVRVVHPMTLLDLSLFPRRQ